MKKFSTATTDSLAKPVEAHPSGGATALLVAQIQMLQKTKPGAYQLFGGRTAPLRAASLGGCDGFGG